MQTALKYRSLYIQHHGGAGPALRGEHIFENAPPKTKSILNIEIAKNSNDFIYRLCMYISSGSLFLHVHVLIGFQSLLNWTPKSVKINENHILLNDVSWGLRFSNMYSPQKICQRTPQSGFGVRKIQHRRSGCINTSGYHSFSRRIEWG